MKRVFAVMLLLFFIISVNGQNNRIEFNGQELFLNGSNVAWVDFARDIGTASVDFEKFGSIFRMAHDYGANSMRLWLHTTGEYTPEFSGDSVVGPGEGAISDLNQILDSAYMNDIGLILCLWSFDMLHESRAVAERNKRFLQTDSLAGSYINNALIPMVDSLQGHPGIIAWEIFNEPEGMCSDVTWGGWGDILHISIADVQKFINRCAGAIHRTDASAKVTNGAWSFISATDVGSNTNYYTDSRLVDAGGDADGILDFYTVHYYDWSDDSPFEHPCSYWELDKPLVIAEFHPSPTCNRCGDFSNYENLYNNGYAGAMGWSWGEVTADDIREEMQYLFNNYTEDVDIDNFLGDAPSLALVLPESGAEYETGETVEFEVDVFDTDGTIDRVEYYIDMSADPDSLLASVEAEPFNYNWTDAPENNWKLYAVAFDNDGIKKKSSPVEIIVGNPPIKKYEAEEAVRSGTPVVENDPEASNGQYVRFYQTGYIEWTIPNVPATAAYDIAFAYRLFGGDKINDIIVNDSYDFVSYQFAGEANVWQVDTIELELEENVSTIKIQASWGWMDFDYIELPFARPVGLYDHLLASGLSSHIYPNPFTDIIYIDTGNDGKAGLVIYNSGGKLILRRELDQGTEKLDLSKYPDGVYIMKMITGKNTDMIKIIKIGMH
jgi:hypothetical protein